MDQLPLSFGKSTAKPKAAQEQAKQDRIEHSKRQDVAEPSPVPSSSKTLEAPKETTEDDVKADHQEPGDEEDGEEGTEAPELPATHEVILKDHTKVGHY